MSKLRFNHDVDDIYAVEAVYDLYSAEYGWVYIEQEAANKQVIFEPNQGFYTIKDVETLLNFMKELDAKKKEREKA